MSHNRKFYKPSRVLLPQKNLLQLACVYGDLPFIDSLLKSEEFNVNEPDQESNCTALHSSVYHGLLGVAALLTSYGASWECKDFDGCSVWDYLNDNRKPFSLINEKSLLYSWGNNYSFNLGSETGNSKQIPIPVKGFERLTVRKIVLSKYHSVILGENGSVYSCGVGESGRLGHGDEETHLSFKTVQTLREKIIDISAGNNHTMFLSEQGYVYSCGSNECGQLGVGNTSENIPTQSLFPMRLNHKDIRNIFFTFIACGSFHSVIATTNKVYTFGRNFGQLGYPIGTLGRSKFIPKLVTMFRLRKETNIICLSACDTATSGILSNNSIFVFENFNCKVYQVNRGNVGLVYLQTFSFTQISSYGVLPEAESSKASQSLQFEIFLLDTFNSVWRFASGNVCIHLCRFENGYDMKVAHFALGKELFLVSTSGELFRCNVPQIDSLLTTKMESYDLIQRSKFEDSVNPILSLDRLKHLHSILCIYTDSHCENFFSLLQDPVSGLVLLPRISSSLYLSDLRTYLDNIQKNPPRDCIDIESKEGKHIFINPFILNVFTSAVCVVKCHLSDSTLHHASKKYKCPLNYETLHSIFLTAYLQNNDVPVELPILLNVLFPNLAQNPIVKTHLENRTFTFTSFPLLHDTVISCLDEESFKCHRCILVARSDYFFSMFSFEWRESGLETSILNFKFTLLIMRIIIEYIYTDVFPRSVHEHNLFQLLIASDHFLLPRLKEWSEYEIANFLTVDNVVPVLELSRMYSAQQLIVSCIEFICINFSWLTSKRELDVLDLDTLALISDCAVSRLRRIGLKQKTVYEYDHYSDLVEQFLENQEQKNVTEISRLEPRGKTVSRKPRRGHSRHRTVSECSPRSIEDSSLIFSPVTISNESWKPNWLDTKDDTNEDCTTTSFQDILSEERSKYLQNKNKSLPRTRSYSSTSSPHIQHYISWGISQNMNFKKTRNKSKRNNSEGEVKKRDKTWSTIEMPAQISFEDIYNQQLTTPSTEPTALYSNPAEISIQEIPKTPHVPPLQPQPAVNAFESIVIEEQALNEFRLYYQNTYPYEQFTIERDFGNEV